MVRFPLFLIAVPLFVAACDDSDSGPSGEELYNGTASAALGAPTNQAQCSTCHAIDASTGFSGASLKDIAYRASYKGGDAPDLLAGTNACVAGWMGGVPLTAEDERWQALEAYLQSISNPAVTTPNSLAPEVLANEAAYEVAYAGGDPTAGAAKYTAACSRCHDTALTLGEASTIPKGNIKILSIGRIAQQVRTSGPPPSGMMDSTDSTPGPMPFFEPDELSAQDLKDIIAFVRQ